MRGGLVLVLLASVFATPVNAATRAHALTGVWEGVFHGGRGDQPVALVCRPRGDDALAGTLYMGGDPLGAIEDAHVTPDSVSFRVIDYSLLGARSGDQLAFQLVVPHGRSHEFTLRFVTADTTAVPASGTAHAPRPPDADWASVPDSVFKAHRVPNDVPSGAMDCLRKGTLFLVGGGPNQNDLGARFVSLAGGPSARVVVIPTASVEPSDTVDARTRGADWARVLGVSHVTVLHTTSRNEADSDAFVKPLGEATAVWLSGGEATRILVSYLGTRTERELLALLDRGGVIGGTSAGAMVWASECQVFHAPTAGNPPGRPEDLEIGDPHGVCFGVLRNVLIAPHFTEFRMQPSVEKTVLAERGVLAIGIDEATALEIHGDLCTVRGRGNVTMFDGRNPPARPAVKLKDGARYDLRKRASV